MTPVEIEWLDRLVPSSFVDDPALGLAAILIEVDRSEGGPVWLQLDTGVPDAILANPPFEGPVRFDPQVPPIPVHKVGSLGSDAFAGTWLVLDLADRRVAVLEAPDPALEASACWVPTKDDRQGRPMVEVSPIGWALVDTGSAPHGVWTWPAEFRRWTGVDPDRATLVGTGTAFGRPVAIHGDPSPVDLAIGAMALGRPTIAWVSGRDTPNRVLGLGAFRDRIVVIDRIAGRFGRVGPCGVPAPE